MVVFFLSVILHNYVDSFLFFNGVKTHHVSPSNAVVRYILKHML